MSGAHHSVKLLHNSETAHRLPHLRGKCMSLHGHSWQIQVTASFPALRRSIGAEFGTFKAGLRGWVDTNLDHGLMLGADDPLAPVLARFPELKLYVFGRGPGRSAKRRWPPTSSGRRWRTWRSCSTGSASGCSTASSTPPGAG